jgi:hypothetical protein
LAVVPERALAEIILDLAAPLLKECGPAPDEANAVLAVVVEFWNASVLAATWWARPQPTQLRRLKTRMCGPDAAPEDAAAFRGLTERWREWRHDPRLVKSWRYDAAAMRLTCTVSAPRGVRLATPPPAELRVVIGGRYLDEVAMRVSASMLRRFPVERHRGVVGDGTVIITTPAATALQLFAEGSLKPVGGGSVEIAVNGRPLGSMVLTAVVCFRPDHGEEVAELAFGRAPGDVDLPPRVPVDAAATAGKFT